MLRGIAALLVVAHHFTTVMWAPPHAVDNIINMPAPIFAGRFVTGLSTLDALLQPGYFDFRHWSGLGVALFFLISGFVIPFAIAQTDRRSFLLGRFWRLWPTYAAGLGLVILTLTLTSTLSGRTLPYDGGMIAAHLALVSDLTGPFALDAVSWTLVIEVRFYILCALLLPLLRRGDFNGLMLTGAFLLTAAAMIGIWCADVTHIPLTYLWACIATGRTFSMMIFMLIGVAFNFHYRGLITLPQLSLGCGWFFALFCGAYLLGPWSMGMGDYLVVYGYALLVFALAYATRRFWRCPRWLAWVTRISYPLYVLHAICGYAVMTILVTYGIDPALAFGAAWSVVIGLAWIIHRWVETPTHDYARALTRRNPLRQAL